MRTVAEFVADLERLISKPRLDRYRPPDHDPQETAVRYLWNVALSESLMQGLAAFEVGLRNAIHFVLTRHTGTEYGFQAVLCPNEMKVVHEAWGHLWKRHQHPPTSGQLVAELNFGFWPKLFGRDYHPL